VLLRVAPTVTTACRHVVSYNSIYQSFQQWIKHCHLSGDSETSECITFVDGKLCVRVEGGQQLLTLTMDKGDFAETKLDEPLRAEPTAQECPQHAQEASEGKPRTACPFTESNIWHGRPGALEVAYVQVKRLLDWEALITQGGGSINSDPAREPEVLMTECTQHPQGLPPRERPRGTMPNKITRKIILGQGPWCEEAIDDGLGGVHANGGAKSTCVLPTL